MWRGEEGSTWLDGQLFAKIRSMEGESWRKVIVGKFGEGEGGWTTREVRESYGMSLWKDIRKGWEEFFLRTSIGIGNALVADLWGRQGDGAGDGRCTLEDLFMIGNWGSKGGMGSRAPLRTRFFAWEAVWGKISTVDMLMRRDKGALDCGAFFFWGGVGVPEFSEKFAS
ncbi:hypothetical protein CK203_085380 [Vitis vinifera]|uniref:Reverse transcriptase zinc-binding domain-containing protein n=1 Tax=Vitis vinifera TaxID=29760 RepID=A0A438E4D6_VITVI|nr:hypothetical protein CK203_085380 [Vitis vinifera]